MSNPPTLSVVPYEDRDILTTHPSFFNWKDALEKSLTDDDGDMVAILAHHPNCTPEALHIGMEIAIRLKRAVHIQTFSEEIAEEPWKKLLLHLPSFLLQAAGSGDTAVWEMLCQFKDKTFRIDDDWCRNCLSFAVEGGNLTIWRSALPDVTAWRKRDNSFIYWQQLYEAALACPNPELIVEIVKAAPEDSLKNEKRLLRAAMGEPMPPQRASA